MKTKTPGTKLLILAPAVLALMLAAPPLTAQSLEEAARNAARQNDAKVLSARTVKQGKGEVHQIRMLTRDGVVKTVKVQKGTPKGAGNAGKKRNKKGKGREDGD